MLYVCVMTTEHMNTGIQRSSATPLAQTQQHVLPEALSGKTQNRKNLTKIMAAHDIPYAAQASPSLDGPYKKKLKGSLHRRPEVYEYTFSPATEAGGVAD